MRVELKRWAEALAVERQHGPDAEQFIARTLALAGDEAGVTRWLDIATRLDQLLDEGAMEH